MRATASALVAEVPPQERLTGRKIRVADGQMDNQSTRYRARADSQTPEPQGLRNGYFVLTKQ